MKKYIVAIIIIGLVAYIVAREIKISRINAENKQLSIALLKLQGEFDSHAKSSFVDLHFDWVTCTPIYDKIIRTGDSINIKVTLTARNTVGDNYSMKETYVTLGKSVDQGFNLVDVYDTIYAKDWLCEMKIKTKGLGMDTIFGEFNIPADNNSILRYPFRATYLKIDNNTYDGIIKLLKSANKK
jgi:hypothetical protein